MANKAWLIPHKDEPRSAPKPTTPAIRDIGVGRQQAGDKRSIAVTFSGDVFDRIRSAARTNGVSFSAQVNAFLDPLFGNHEAPPSPPAAAPRTKVPGAIDMTLMDIPALQELRAQLERAIEVRRAAETDDILAQVRDMAARLGLSPVALLNEAIRSEANAGEVGSGMLYRHPSQPNITWNGRGRLPKWIADHEEAGYSRASLLVTRRHSRRDRP